MNRILTTALFLLVAICASADGCMLDTLVLKSLVASRALPQERVYLHFDNSGYYLGETMWFKVLREWHWYERWRAAKQSAVCGTLRTRRLCGCG